MFSPFPLTPFYFLRHGETDWNKQHIFMGQQDIPLNNTGIAQAQEAAKILAREPIAHIVTSPLRRALKTAEIVNDVLKKDISVLLGLKEATWGPYEGMPCDRKITEKWLRNEAAEGCERVDTFEQRVVKTFREALLIPGPILIVAHSGSHLVFRRHFGLPLVKTPHAAPLYYQPSIVHEPLPLENNSSPTFKDNPIPWSFRDLSAL